MLMGAQIIDGTAVAAKLRSGIAEQSAALKHRGITPGLAVVLVGDDPASHSYVRAKEKACAENGIYSEDIRLSAETQENELLGVVDRLNAATHIHGILVQLPLPPHIDGDAIIQRISPDKDVDGFHPVSLGNLMLEREGFISCTPCGIIKLLESENITTEGKHCVVVGRSNIVGKPLANFLLGKHSYGNATVTVCHSKTPDIARYTKQADILIAAVGRAEMIKADMVKEGAVVIDVGTNRRDDPTKKCGYRIVGDVDFAQVSRKAAFITPVPGGVGPMTITMLLWNTLESAKRFTGCKRFTE